MGRTVVIMAASIGALAMAGPAAADAIDGNWCASDGRSMSISGPDIVSRSFRQKTSTTTSGENRRTVRRYQAASCTVS